MSRQGHPRIQNHKNIKEFWEKEASEIGASPEVTIRDFYFRLHELHTMIPLIPVCSRIVDMGCGTGFGTLAFAKRATYILGIDFSEKMIKWANKLKDDSAYRSKISKSFSHLWSLTDSGVSEDKIKFRRGDIVHLSLKEDPFDVITGQRILINLSSHKEQMKALEQLRKYAVRGGLIILTEATIQGHQRTDEYRKIFNLPKLEKYWHNNYVDEGRFHEWRKTGWIIKYNLGYETYMLLSKVIYPAACGHDKCQFLSGANAAAMEMASLFRSKCAVDELGQDAFFQMYIERVQYYDPKEGDQIFSWIERNKSQLPDWAGLGHQRLIVAYAE